MIFERIKTPGIAHICYLIADKGPGIVVDPGRDIGRVLTAARTQNLSIGYILETHRQED